MKDYAREITKIMSNDKTGIQSNTDMINQLVDFMDKSPCYITGFHVDFLFTTAIRALNFYISLYLRRRVSVRRLSLCKVVDKFGLSRFRLSMLVRFRHHS